MYARAREQQEEFYFDQVLKIADDAAEAPSSDKTNAARLQVDSRKWSLAVMNRAKYGDRRAFDHGGQPDNPLNVVSATFDGSNMSPEELERARKFGESLLQKGTEK